MRKITIRYKSLTNFPRPLHFGVLSRSLYIWMIAIQTTKIYYHSFGYLPSKGKQLLGSKTFLVFIRVFSLIIYWKQHVVSLPVSLWCRWFRRHFDVFIVKGTFTLFLNIERNFDIMCFRAKKKKKKTMMANWIWGSTWPNKFFSTDFFCVNCLFVRSSVCLLNLHCNLLRFIILVEPVKYDDTPQNWQENCKRRSLRLKEVSSNEFKSHQTYITTLHCTDAELLPVRGVKFLKKILTLFLSPNHLFL